MQQEQWNKFQNIMQVNRSEIVGKIIISFLNQTIERQKMNTPDKDMLKYILLKIKVCLTQVYTIGKS